jgi:hypothetical protein
MNSRHASVHNHISQSLAINLSQHTHAHDILSQTLFYIYTSKLFAIIAIQVAYFIIQNRLILHPYLHREVVHKIDVFTHKESAMCFLEYSQCEQLSGTGGQQEDRVPSLNY